MNSPAPAWIEEARSLLAEGMSAEAIGKRVGKSGETVRIHLDIKGAAERYRKKLARCRLEGKNLAERRRVVHVLPEVIAPPPVAAKVSLPFVAILAGHVSPSYQMVSL